MGDERDQKRTASPATSGSASKPATVGKRTGDPDAAPRPKAGVHEMFKPNDAAVTKSTMASPQGIVIERVTAWATDAGNAMLIIAPGMEAHATVELKDDVDPDPDPVTVGWTQTIDSSQRVAVYKFRGGPNAGKPGEARVVSLPARTRDTQPAHQEWAPFYGKPETLDAGFRSQHVSAQDQPNFPIATRLGDDLVLDEIRGADTFTIRLAAGPKEAPVPLRSFKWSVPWNVKIPDPKKSATGTDSLGIHEDEKVDASKPLANDKTATKDSLILYPDVPSAVAALQDKPISEFLRLMERHKQISPDSFWNMVGALWKSNARFVLDIMPRAGAGLDGDDRKRSYALKFGAKSHSFGEVKAGTYSCLGHQVYDPPELGPGKDVTVMVNGVSEAHFAWPFDKELVDQGENIEGGLFGQTKYGYTIKLNLVK